MICPSTQMRPRRPIQPPTACSTVRTGTGDSAEVSIAMLAAYAAARLADARRGETTGGSRE
ncbi:hypothetical protein Arub01_03860 [Actinomadura rubrobrunea]|uniref:Uncharacterized protein n=1 Tax=Actinomadura rubrobrunea TaxID=115335 RepID=A0A9W6PSM3_9ACTN|nr:hypothetical protein Arub01_03860 [Actinomadura rubrobrunea]